MANIGKTQRADLILGQSSMTANSTNQGASAPTEYTLSSYVSSLGVMQGSLLFDTAGDLFVADPANNRILNSANRTLLRPEIRATPLRTSQPRKPSGRPAS